LLNILGIDIGGTKCSIILGQWDNRTEAGLKPDTSEEISVIDKVKFPTCVERGVEYTLQRIFENIEAILLRNNLKREEIYSIGISCGGPLDSKRGIIMSPPNLYGWDNIKIVELLEQQFGIKAKLQNDANACGLAEWKFGAAKGYENAVFLTFGTGMGSGLILGGRLYSGTNDMAGEVGHIRLDRNGPVGYGKSGSFEGFCSGGGIAQLAKVKVLEELQMGKKVSFCNGLEEIDKLDAKIVGDAAENGDALAKEIYEICGDYLGRGLSILIDLLNPEVIVIGSIFARSKDLIWPAASKIIEKESLSHSKAVCKVVPAGLGEKIGDLAALAVAIYE
jgi:glucokinase